MVGEYHPDHVKSISQPLFAWSLLKPEPDKCFMLQDSTIRLCTGRGSEDHFRRPPSRERPDAARDVRDLVLEVTESTVLQLHLYMRHRWYVDARTITYRSTEPWAVLVIRQSIETVVCDLTVYNRWHACVVYMCHWNSHEITILLQIFHSTLLL